MLALDDHQIIDETGKEIGDRDDSGSVLNSPPKPETAPVIAPLTVDDMIKLGTSLDRKAGPDDVSLIVHVDDTQSEIDADLEISGVSTDEIKKENENSNNEQNDNSSVKEKDKNDGDAKSESEGKQDTNKENESSGKEVSASNNKDASKEGDTKSSLKSKRFVLLKKMTNYDEQFEIGIFFLM